MEGLKKAASGAVESIRNSPLFKRKFGTRPDSGASPTVSPAVSPAVSPSQNRRPGAISPENDTTPFVQGVYFHVGVVRVLCNQWAKPDVPMCEWSHHIYSLMGHSPFMSWERASGGGIH